MSLAQAIFVLIIGIAATFWHTSAAPMEEMAQTPEAQTATEDTEILTKLNAFFEARINRLARRLGVPDRRVSNAINRAHSMNVSQFVNTFRIKDACDLLCQTDQSVLQISMSVGFTSKSNFNREFVRITGKTPSKWRTENAAPLVSER